MKKFLFTVLLLLSVNRIGHARTAAEVIKQLSLPEGFTISIYSDRLPGARSLALGDQGIVFVGTMEQGKVYAVKDSDGNGSADRIFEIASGLYMPNGVAYRDGTLYVAETNRIISYPEITDNLTNPPKPTVIYDKLPSDRHHGWKYLRFGPDGKLYTAVGAPCNICLSEKEIYTSLLRIDPVNKKLEILAHGIRNSVGLEWSPNDGKLYFTDNGRDYLGDDLPPDELNVWTEKNQHFGYPFCHGGTIPDPEFGKEKKCSEFKPPVWRFKAHIAPLGLHFYRGKQFPSSYHNQLLVAQHGSWNRSVPQGYQVALITFDNGKPVSEKPFIKGWLTDKGEVLGRPVDILELPSGNLLISDDHLGVIYKVSYRK